MRTFWTKTPAPSVLLCILYSLDIQQKCISQNCKFDKKKYRTIYKLRTIFWILYIVQFPIKTSFFGWSLFSLAPFLYPRLSFFEENRVEAHGNGIHIILWFILSHYCVFSIYYLLFALLGLIFLSFKEGRSHFSNAQREKKAFIIVNDKFMAQP